MSSAFILTCVALMGQAPSARPTGPVRSCVTSQCHGDILAHKVLHGPAAQKKCDACHSLSDPAGHLFTLTVPKNELCTFCHVQTHRTVVHKPVAEGECTGCHDPHGSDYRFVLVDDPAGGLCFRCHPADGFTDKKYVHGPVAAGACVVCHESHSSWNPKLLVKDERQLCLFCHEDVQARLASARHPHKPVAEGRCLTCHDPHASDHKAQLRGGAPGLCFSCHEHEKIKALIETSARVHGAVTTEDSCTGCHEGHGGALPKLLKAPLLNLCLSCHDKPLQTPEGKTIMDMAALLKNNPDHHGPVRRADCSACHNPHASPNFRLLRKDYPELFYAPFDLEQYDLCFTCHVKELVTLENGTGVTGFRDADVNLHFVHVNRKKKGRTCRACHEVHASKRPFHIREKAPFGGWEIEINYEKLPDGGRCAPGCHKEKTYSRGPGGKGPTTRAGLKADAKK